MMASSTEPTPRSPHPRRPLVWLVACTALLAVVVTTWRARWTGDAGRDATLERLLSERGLEVDPDATLWLEKPPLGLWRSATGQVPVVVRARPGPDEPHDIYLAAARLTPEGVLLSLGRAHNMTETSAVDEQPPVGGDGWFAFVEQGMLGDEAPSRVKLIDLAGEPPEGRRSWSRLQRLQAAMTRIQQTGRIAGVSRFAYTLEPVPKRLTIRANGDHLRVEADERAADVVVSAALDVPEWLGVEATPERRPGNLVTWAVDRVRNEIGDEAMQYIKAIAFSALDVVRSGSEDLTGDTGEDDIAEDLGQDSLEPIEQKVPVDPEIGFPPPPLETWVTPALPGEGVWNAKKNPAFFHTLPGLPATFVTTFVRSDRRRKTTRVYIALWDPRMLQLNMMAGVAEPKSATGATGPGLIPREPMVLKRVAAAMNAGFQALHGEYGMMSDGVVYLPPKPYGATVALMNDGSTAFGTWPNDTSIPEGMVSYRQNMTPIVVDKKFNPYGRTWWGGTPADWEDKTHTTRTGICRTEEGFVGYFYGNELSPEALARAMIQTRCDYALALDMNAGHSGLEFYKVAPEAELPELGRPISRDWEREGKVRDMDGWKFRARRLIRGMGLMNFPRYIGREGRDFFYLTLRYVLPGEPLASAGKADEGDGQWQVKGLPQHGFPYALAKTSVALASKQRVRVLQVDPRMVTTRREQAVENEGEPAVLAVANVTGQGELSLWQSNAAFSVGATPLAPGSVRIVSGARRADRAAAAVGVRTESGMLVYVEAVGEDGKAAGAELTALLESLGCELPLLLGEPLALALGGDTDLAGEGVRLPPADEQVVLWRRAGPRAMPVFESTPIVPLKEWYPLQARRIRYFKKDTDS